MVSTSDSHAEMTAAAAAPLAGERVDERPPAQPAPRQQQAHEAHAAGCLTRPATRARALRRAAEAPTMPRKRSSSEPAARRLRRRGALRAQLGDRPLRHEAPLVEDADVVGEALDDLEHVRGEEDRAAAAGELVQEALDEARGDGVDPFERLVEEEQARRGSSAIASDSFFFMPCE
jgi:hypothetical protein